MTFSRPFSWNSHAILTRAALRSAGPSALDADVAVVGIEDFLSAAADSLPTIVRWYQDLLDRKAGGVAAAREASDDIRTEGDFLWALRLNPSYRLHYVRLLGPQEVSPGSPHDTSRSGPPGGAYEDVPRGGRQTPREVLCAFSDEPDWGMDQDLFTVEGYNYGPSPYGGDTGMSSQAPFHMAFLYESPIFAALVPRLRKSFMEERVRVFLALAQLAFAKGIAYWGWRFSSWAMHYLQDLTQPYHARALPFSLLKIIRRAQWAGNWRAFAAANRNLLRNRHVLFEAVTHFLLNDAVKRYSTHPLLLSLAGGGESTEGTVGAVMKQAASVAASLAAKADESVARLIDDPRIEDPRFSLADHPDYDIEETVWTAASDRSDAFEQFMELLCACLAEAGKVTRLTVRRTDALRGPGS